MKKMFLSMVVASTCLIADEQTTSLLNDTEEIQSYVANFPMHRYKVVDVPNQGKFYIDDINDVVKNVLRSKIVWEQHIVNLLKKYIKPGSVAVDIGSHIGTHTITMANAVGPRGSVWAFEPQKKIYRELIANCLLNHVETRVNALRYALGDVQAVIEMHPSVAGNEAGTPIGHGGDIVEMRTLDSFKLKNVSVIKLDAEGSEDIVLDGAVETILTNRPVIIIEICGGWRYATAPDYIRAKIDHTKDKLSLLGYDVIFLQDHDYLAIPKLTK